MLWLFFTSGNHRNANPEVFHGRNGYIKLISGMLIVFSNPLEESTNNQSDTQSNLSNIIDIKLLLIYLLLVIFSKR